MLPNFLVQVGYDNTNHQLFGRNAGRQSSSIALYFLAFGILLAKPLSEWIEQDIHNVMFAGTNHYDFVMAHTYGSSRHNLVASDIPSCTVACADMADQPVNIIFHDISLSGIVPTGTLDSHDACMSSTNLPEVLTLSSSISPYMLISIQGSTMALLRHSNGMYTLFHSHGINRYGYPQASGSAGLLQFQSRLHLIQYLSRMFPHEYYEVRPVFVTPHTIDPTPHTIDPTASSLVLSARCHQGNVFLFGAAAGRQCTSIALAFLLMNTELATNESEWNESYMFSAMLEGSTLYSSIISDTYNGVPRYLMHEDLPTRINAFNATWEVTYYRDEIFGILGRESSSSTSHGALSIHDALLTAASISPNFLLTLGTSTVAVISRGDTFTIIDSHARNESGMPSSNGTARMFHFQSRSLLVTYLIKVYNQQQFDITPVTISKLRPGIPNSQSVNVGQIHDNNDTATNNSNQTNNVSDNVGQIHDDNDTATNNSNQTNNVSDSASTIQTHTYTANQSMDATAHEIINNHTYCVHNHTDTAQHPMDTSNSNTGHEIFKNHTYCQTVDVCTVNLNNLSTDDLKYEQQIRLRASHNCDCCHKILFEDQLSTLQYNFDIATLLNLPHTSDEFTLCSICFNTASKKGHCPASSVSNNLDAGVVPPQLLGLGTVEKRLISQIQSYLTILILPGGQYAERGLTIHFPLDMDSYYQQLQNISSNKYLYVVVSKPNQNETQVVSMQHIADMKKVKQALQWLHANNPLYKTLDLFKYEENVSTNQSLFSSDDCTSNITHLLHSGQESGVTPMDYSVPDVNITDVINSNNTKSLTLPVKYHQPTWIAQVQNGEEMAFPWLFPYGKSGLNDNRNSSLTVLKYFQQRLYNKSPRWRQNITYLMFAVNHMEQAKLSADISIQMRVDKPSQPVTASSVLNSTPDIRSNCFMFMKNIRGTVAFWSHTLSNLLATVKCLGPPTLFVTLSADDNHWPELEMLLRDCDYDDASSTTSKAEYVRKDPLLTSLHFERRWKAFLKYVLKSPEQPLGEVQDYFARVEYQNRGSPHLHIFLWIKGAPTFQTSTEAEITRYIDQVIKTRLPSKDNDTVLYHLVKKLQTHHHTWTCQRGPALCRFGFPRTITTLTHILQNINITTRGRFYETVRSKDDLYINAYNPKLLKRWRANMDIQMVGAAHGLAYYVCTYIAKSEPDDLKDALSSTIQRMTANPQEFSPRRQLHLIGNCVLKTRRMSAQEAAARIGNLHLVWSTRHVVYLNARPKKLRYKILKPKARRDQLPPNSTDIFETNIIDYYVDRPQELMHLSLFKFASWYRLSSSPSTAVSSRCQPRITLKTLGKILQKKRIANVIRTPKFPSQSEEYLYSLLMLHLPFTNEDDILHPYDNAKIAFLHKNDRFNITDFQYESYLHDIDKVVHLLQSSHDEVGVSVAPNTHEVYNDTSDVSPDHAILCADELPCDDFINNVELQDTSANDLLSLKLPTISEFELQKCIAQLNAAQHAAFASITSHFDTSTSTPLRMFITGGAGTGKSYLINTVVQWIRLFACTHAGLDPVLVCGPTGMSARNIQGRTLHSVFKLPVQHGREPEYKELSNQSLQKLRSLYRSVHTILIDEISMVSSNTLTYVHRRLCTLKESTEFFGGLNIIVIGDFFQLKPVRGQFAFQNTILWDLFTPCMLNVNMRQNKATQYRDLLNRVRIGQHSVADVSTLVSRLIENDNSSFEGALRIYATRKEVEMYNMLKQDAFNSNTITVHAHHTYTNSHLTSNSNDDIELHIPQDDRKAGGLPRVFQFTEQTRVMLLRNIATEHGLVNGALGFVQHADYENDIPIRIYVRFDNSSIGRVMHNAEHNAIPIEQISQEFHSNGRSICRTQFPLAPAWACTIHKVQGITCSKIVINLGKTIFAQGQAYVALSRVTSLQGLGLLAFDPTKVKAHPDVLQYYNSLNDSNEKPKL